MVAVVILLLVLECRCVGNELSNVRSFSILLSGEVLTSFRTITVLTFLVNKGTMKTYGVYIVLTIHEKTLNQISYS